MTRSKSKITFGTKSGTLTALSKRISAADVLPIFLFTYSQWQDWEDVLDRLKMQSWSGSPLIIRSSAQSEDTSKFSNAGRFTSVKNISVNSGIKEAVDQVFSSYDTLLPHDQVFIQPYLKDATNVGVIFTREPNTGGPYFVISFDDEGGTDTVTAGKSNSYTTIYHHRENSQTGDPILSRLLVLAEELIALLEDDCLDIEFGISPNSKLYLFQVRPLVLNRDKIVDPKVHYHTVYRIADKISVLMKPHPFLLGKRTIFGTMPDWNPAEIIGVRPRPLALSLYRELITDTVWAYQRSNYGYRNLRSFPLIRSFHGLPYIDVRVSCNSFIPHDLDDDLGNRLVDYYLDRLERSPNLHDKIEFEIVYSCYTLDLDDRLARLDDYGFSKEDKDNLSGCLKQLTGKIMNNTEGKLRSDLAKFDVIPERRERIINSDLDKVSKVFWLLEDCKRYGTLPFAGVARAAFISVQLLRSLVQLGLLDDIDTYMESLETISGKITSDFEKLDKNVFLSRYGHLRPGTYDILSPRYDEDPDLYFDWSNRGKEAAVKKSMFQLSSAQRRKLAKLLLDHHFVNDVDEFLYFIKTSIEGREFGKFVFSQNLSAAIQILGEIGEECGLTKEDISYLNIRSIYECHASSMSNRNLIVDSILHGKETYAAASKISLPTLITRPSDVFSFCTQEGEPNFITQKSVTAKRSDYYDRTQMRNAIVMIPSADPGFDWIFSHDIAGLITAYGGANSHMAIRAGELGIPAVIGVGEETFSRWSQAEMLRVDCMAKHVECIDVTP